MWIIRNYETVNGVLYTKDHTHLVLFPETHDIGGLMRLWREPR